MKACQQQASKQTDLGAGITYRALSLIIQSTTAEVTRRCRLLLSLDDVATRAPLVTVNQKGDVGSRCVVTEHRIVLHVMVCRRCGDSKDRGGHVQPTVSRRWEQYKEVWAWGRGQENSDASLRVSKKVTQGKSPNPQQTVGPTSLVVSAGRCRYK